MAAIVSSALQALRALQRFHVRIDGTAVAGFPVVADYSKTCLHVAKHVNLHGNYGCLDDSVLDFTGNVEPIVGHASYNDNSTILGTKDFDHHYSYQAYPHKGGACTLDKMGGFFMQPDVTAGVVNTLYQHMANDPTGTGTINTQYGFYCSELARGASNYAFYARGDTAKSYFGGGVDLGVGGVSQATLRYNSASGDLEFTPRAAYDAFMKSARFFLGVAGKNNAAYFDNNTDGNLYIYPRLGFNAYLKTQTLYIGSAANAFAAYLDNNPDGNLYISPRAGFNVKIAAGKTQFVDKIYPATDAATFQATTGVYAGTGAPNNANGANNDFYLRGDGGALTTIYQKRAGAWVGVI